MQMWTDGVHKEVDTAFDIAVGKVVAGKAGRVRLTMKK